MKILWLINIMLPCISEKLNISVNNAGGWMVTLSNMLPKDHELVICYPDTECREIIIDNVKYCGFIDSDNEKQMDSIIKCFCKILKDEKPDVIHIWGTEHLHSYAMTEAAKITGLSAKTIISIQGLVSVYSQHFMAGLPHKVQNIGSIRDYFRNDTLKMQNKKMRKRGEYEIRSVKNVSHVIGRTNWDYICVKQINENVVYHHNNEILRSTFYNHIWNIDDCNKYSIFTSQAQHPIKGFHVLLKAVKIISNKYKNTRLYVAGVRNPMRHTIRSTRYESYIYNLAKKYGILDNIVYVGNLSEQAMCERYLKSHVFVCPSSIENSSNSIGEAMILGMPIIASFVGGTSDILKDKEDGFLYPFDASYMLAGYLDKVFSDDVLSVKMGENARKRAVVTHDIDKNYKDLCNIYASVSN